VHAHMQAVWVHEILGDAASGGRRRRRDHRARSPRRPERRAEVPRVPCLRTSRHRASRPGARGCRVRGRPRARARRASFRDHRTPRPGARAPRDRGRAGASAGRGRPPLRRRPDQCDPGARLRAVGQRRARPSSPAPSATRSVGSASSARCIGSSPRWAPRRGRRRWRGSRARTWSVPQMRRSFGK
jgi:hypothetical protein